MSAATTTDLRKKDLSELEELLGEKRAEVMSLRFSLATGALENPARLGIARREVARVLTVVGEKQRAAAPAMAKATAPEPETTTEGAEETA